MDLFTLLASSLVLTFFILFILLLLSDCDLVLAYFDKFGTKLSDLNGQVIWITGASQGIGRACALASASLGAKLILSARSEQLLANVKKECIDASVKAGHGLEEEDVLILPMDMVDFDQHEEHVQRVITHFGKIDMMVHNAGRSQRARWEHIELGVDKALFDLNVFSVVNLSRLIIPHFQRQGRGTFCLVSSIAGKFGVPYSGSYTGSKHALNGYFAALSMEKVGTGIEVVTVCPGPVFSNLMSDAATEKNGEKLAQTMGSTDNRMTTERCAHLTLVAAAHSLGECWMANFPLMPISYVAYYFPGLTKRFIRMVGPRFMLKLRDSKDNHVKTQ